MDGCTHRERLKADDGMYLYVAYTMSRKEEKRRRIPKITPYRGKEEHEKEEEREKKLGSPRQP